MISWKKVTEWAGLSIALTTKLDTGFSMVLFVLSSSFRVRTSGMVAVGFLKMTREIEMI